MSTIIVTHEDNEVDEFDFAKDCNVISIGRRSSNDVCVPNLSVSGKHARITIENAEAWIEDLNSTNGTYINGRLIARQLLHHDDEIIMGKVRLNFLDPDNATSAATQTEQSSAQHSQSAGHANEEVMAHANDELDDSFGEQHSANVEEKAESLSDKARVALGREPVRETVIESAMDAARPTLHAVGAVAGAGVAAAAASSSSSADAAVDETPVLRNEAPASPSEPANKNAHPLEGITEEDIQQPMHELDSPSTPSRGAVIEIKNGAKSGQILPIDKPVTTLGRPGIQIAAIMRKPDGYFLMHIESDDSVDRPTLNRDAIGDEPVLLQVTITTITYDRDDNGIV